MAHLPTVTKHFASNLNILRHIIIAVLRVLVRANMKMLSMILPFRSISVTLNRTILISIELKHDTLWVISGALADYNEVLRLNSQPAEAYAEVYNDRGSIHYHLRNSDSAILDYTASIRLDPKNAIVYNNRGEGYFANGNFKKALKDFGEPIDVSGKQYDFGRASNHSLRAWAEDRSQTHMARSLVQDQRYGDADWVGKELNWIDPLVEAARKLIAEL